MTSLMRPITRRPGGRGGVLAVGTAGGPVALYEVGEDVLECRAELAYRLDMPVRPAHRLDGLGGRRRGVIDHQLERPGSGLANPADALGSGQRRRVEECGHRYLDDLARRGPRAAAGRGPKAISRPPEISATSLHSSASVTYWVVTIEVTPVRGRRWISSQTVRRRIGSMPAAWARRGSGGRVRGPGLRPARGAAACRGQLAAPPAHGPQVRPAPAPPAPAPAAPEDEPVHGGHEVDVLGDREVGVEANCCGMYPIRSRVRRQNALGRSPEPPRSPRSGRASR